MNWSILATNESGSWENITGKYGSPFKMQENAEAQWSSFTWQNSNIPMGLSVGWRIYFNDTEGNVNATPIMSFTIHVNPVIVDDDAVSSWYDRSHVKTIHEGVTNITAVGGIIQVRSGTYNVGYSSSERLVVSKQISLLGENRDTTIIYNFRSRGNGIKITHDHVTMSDFTIRNSRLGYPPVDPPFAAVSIERCDYTTVQNVLITDNDFGILILEGSYNTIMQNTIQNSYFMGMETYVHEVGTNASWNTIYHNNFINNTLPALDVGSNTWDDGYPEGGNYWATNYSGADVNPRDGIGDIAYPINASDNQDHYPFIQQNGWLLNDPPLQPSSPEGPLSVNVGERYTYTVSNVVDPYSYDVSCWFSWGDGTSSGWSAFKTSDSSFNASHIWQHTGTFSVSVKAKDARGRESLWSSSITVTASGSAPPPPPPVTLTLESPSYVLEGSLFQVNVTAEGTPVHNALVSLLNRNEYTNSNGVAYLQAPYVSQDTIYSLTATHEDYESASQTITVLDERPSIPEGGFVYGTVTDTSGRTIENAYISIQLAPGVTLKKFTGEYGYYVLIPAGLYMIEVGKRGYKSMSIANITIDRNMSTKLDFVLESTSEENPQSTSNQQRDLLEAMIENGIFANKVTGELNLAPESQEYNVTLYEEQLMIKNISMNASKVSFVVNGTGLAGTILVLRFFSTHNLSNITVEYDNMTLDQISFTDLFSLSNGNQTPTYTWMKITKENYMIVYCLVYVPHFSDHGITVHLIEEIITTASTLVTVIFYLLVCFIAGVVFFSPFVLHFIRRVYFFKKK